MDNPEVENQTAEQPKSEAELPKMDVEALQEQLQSMKSQNERLLNESKGHADKYRKLRDSVENQQKAELEKSENWKELLEREKQEKFDLGEQMKQMKESVLRQSLNFEVAKYASDAHKVERVIGAVLDHDTVRVSDDGTQFEGIKEVIETLRNDEPYLFKQDKPAGMVNTNPSGKAPKNKTLSEMNKTEKDSIFKNSIAEMLKTGR